MVVYATAEGKALTVGTDGFHSFRAEGRLDVPFGKADPGEDTRPRPSSASLRGGQDAIDKTNLVGSDAMIGVRYHSSGFIAEAMAKLKLTFGRAPAGAGAQRPRTAHRADRRRAREASGRRALDVPTLRLRRRRRSPAPSARAGRAETATAPCWWRSASGSAEGRDAWRWSCRC